MKSNTLLLVGGAGLAYMMFAKAANTKNALFNLEYSNPKVKFEKIGLGSITLQMTMDFDNKSSQLLAMEYFTGYVYYKGKALSAFTFDGKGQNITLNPRTKTTVPFSLVIKNYAAITTLVQLVRSVTSGQKLDTVIVIDGRFYAAGIDVPVKFGWDVKTNSLASIPGEKVAGIGSASARLTFRNNDEMTNYFRQDQIRKYQPKQDRFSKN